MSSPVIVLQAGFSAGLHLKRRTARPEFYKPSGKCYFWEFFSSGRGFRQFVGCAWQVFSVSKEKMLSSPASSHFENSTIHIIAGLILPAMSPEIGGGKQENQE